MKAIPKKTKRDPFYVVDIKDDIYVQINDSDLYFVIDKKYNLVKTITPISQERLLIIIKGGND
ncbi:hypothetical protein [Spiroplasma endosymbiont of 'Nebria riversi']|uniref:hypothetical protein n=1 Tax=Spiroplasma endosymbiont of 'Nebria riversi' TaxID=2792084 RepID=UPI001C05507B|nr:hypothetical protein [Spiroplasma endosymbiont of 'Nebria riversi']